MSKNKSEESETVAVKETEVAVDPRVVGSFNLLTCVDFVDAHGEDVHLDPGVIAGIDLPEAFALDLIGLGKLVKK